MNVAVGSYGRSHACCFLEDRFSLALVCLVIVVVVGTGIKTGCQIIGPQFTGH